MNKKFVSRLCEKLDDFSLVWEDDFSGDTLNHDKWNLDTHMRGQKDLEIRYDESAVKVENGCAVLSSGKTDTKDIYFTNASLTTSDRMIFKYGYVVMRAKVPFGAPSFPSFWMKSAKIEHSDVMGEIDIFEHYCDRANSKALTTALHLWYEDGIHMGKEVAWHIFESKEVAEGWHDYGFLWTPEGLEFLVDGISYGAVFFKEPIKTIRNNNGTDEEIEWDIDEFKDYYYLIMNNYIFTEKGINHKGFNASSEMDFPIEYKIDYVRLYQKNGEGSIKLLK